MKCISLEWLLSFQLGTALEENDVIHWIIEHGTLFKCIWLLPLVFKKIVSHSWVISFSSSSCILYVITKQFSKKGSCVLYSQNYFMVKTCFLFILEGSFWLSLKCFSPGFLTLNNLQTLRDKAEKSQVNIIFYYLMWAYFSKWMLSEFLSCS